MTRWLSINLAFLAACRQVAKEYPEVMVDDYHIDAMTAHLVRRPNDFDVIVTGNMFGDILSDLTGELVESLELAASINTNEHQVMAQAAHGSAPDIAGRNIANPFGLMLSVVMLLDWLAGRYDDKNLAELAPLMENALMKTISDGVCTRELGGHSSTTEFTAGIIKRLD